MTTKQLWILVTVIILIVLVIGAVFLARQDGVSDDIFTTPQDQQDDTGADNGTVQQPIVVTHNFEDGTHRFSGSVPVPTPCHTLTAEAQVAESFPEQITIQLRTVAPAPDIVCTQVLDRKTFDIVATASSEARLVGVTLDGVRLPFEVFEEAKG